MANKKTHFTVLLVFPKVFEYCLIYFREVRLLTTLDIGNIPATNCRYNPKNEISRNGVADTKMLAAIIARPFKTFMTVMI